ncbi:MAG: CBS domain-containing protein [Gammaproteobacteria bacterium]|jgi:CBS domain-containing protein
MPLETPIVQIIERDPVSLDVNQKVSEAMRLLTSGRFHHLPIVSGGELVGLLSTTDVLELNFVSGTGEETEWLDFLDAHYQLDDVMTQDLVTVSHRATVGDAARQLSAGGFHSLPVVDNENALVGIVTTTDLVSHMLEASPEAELSAAMQQKVRALERVYAAAQAFLHSGMAAQEHHKLELALEAAREADDTTPVSL